MSFPRKDTSKLGGIIERTAVVVILHFYGIAATLKQDGEACGGTMRGIDFVKNKRGQKTAVLIDLKRHGQLWEDFYDSVVVRNRAREPRESLDAVKDRLRRLGKLRG